jgi:hypothetical protein
MMTPEEKALVQSTFAQLVPIADQAASLFYARLFETLDCGRCSGATWANRARS